VKQVALGESQGDWLVRSIGARLPIDRAVEPEVRSGGCDVVVGTYTRREERTFDEA
jgi:hypothetical protein